MVLPLSTVMALALQCGPSVAPISLAAVARAESGFDPLAIGINGAHPQSLHPRSAAEATLTANRLIAAGENLDLGLAQINVRNLGWLGLTVETAFDPCTNLAASARVLGQGYGRAARAGADAPTAFRTALSYYNTGSPVRGVTNGYVDKVLAAVRSVSEGADTAAPPPPDPGPPPPAWDVFAQPQQARAGFVFSPSATGDTP